MAVVRDVTQGGNNAPAAAPPAAPPPPAPAGGGNPPPPPPPGGNAVAIVQQNQPPGNGGRFNLADAGLLVALVAGAVLGALFGPWVNDHWNRVEYAVVWALVFAAFYLLLGWVFGPDEGGQAPAPPAPQPQAQPAAPVAAAGAAPAAPAPPAANGTLHIVLDVTGAGVPNANAQGQINL